MPYIAALKTDGGKTAYLQRLFNETYLQDIVDRNNIKNDGELSDHRLVHRIAHQPTETRKHLPKRQESQYLGTNHKEVPRIPGGSLHDQPAKRYDIKGKKHISTPLKYYFEDIGLRNARLNFRQQEETHIMENILYSELVVRGYQVDVGVVDTMESGKRKRIEIDFVANQGSKRYYIQSAFALPDAEKRMREERPLVSVNDSFKKIIVIGGNVKLSRDERGITTMGIKEFLLNSDSLDL